MRFSGKDADGVPLKGHAHSYICPLDVDRDGFIDHLSVRCKEAYETDEVLALDRLDRLPWVGGHDLLLTPIRTAMDWGEDGCWTMVSRTPYVCGRHYRRGRGDFMEWMRAELVRDLKDAGLPEPHSIQHVPSLSGARGDIQWFQFIRSRKNEQANFGYGFRLVFDRPVPPLYNIGYGAHFGLGLFVQDDP
jgi:CRISPR-associated protein Csb2